MNQAGRTSAGAILPKPQARGTEFGLVGDIIDWITDTPGGRLAFWLGAKKLISTAASF